MAPSLFHYYCCYCFNYYYYSCYTRKYQHHPFSRVIVKLNQTFCLSNNDLRILLETCCCITLAVRMFGEEINGHTTVEKVAPYSPTTPISTILSVRILRPDVSKSRNTTTASGTTIDVCERFLTQWF